MSRIKELKQHPENNFNLIDMLATVCPEGKTKYVETLLRLIKKSNNLDNFIIEVKKEMVTKYNMKMEALDEMLPFHIIFLYRFFDSMFEAEDIVTFQKFCEYNEKGLIPNNDVSTYKSFQEIIDATGIASLKVEDKEMESQIVKLFEDKEWLVIRPLTYRSSRKYGSNTKWCTTQENNPEYFRKYTTNGILIYIMNKITGFKVAFYNALNGETDFGFWSQTDNKVDSLLAGVPMNILELIQNEIKTNPVTNRFLLSDEQKMKEEAALIKMGLGSKSLSPSPIEMTVDVIGEDEDRNEYPAISPQMEQIVSRRNQERIAREKRLGGDDMFAEEEKISKDYSYNDDNMKAERDPEWYDGDDQEVVMVKSKLNNKLNSLQGVIDRLNEPMQAEKIVAQNLSSGNPSSPMVSSNSGIGRG